MKTASISKIETSSYEGDVYNLELKSNDPDHDDLFWICNDVVVHNCFPKDMNALMFVAKSLGIEPHVMNGAWAKNLEVRPPEHRDWEAQEGRAVSKD